MGNAKCGFAGKTFACLMGFVLAAGLMPGVALADEDYPDVNERVYVGPETQTTRDVGNVTVDTGDPKDRYAVFAHSKNDQDATANVHGSIELTTASIPDTSAAVANAQVTSNTATVNVAGDVTANSFAKDGDDMAVFGLAASAEAFGSNAVANVGGTVTSRVTRSDAGDATLEAVGVIQKAGTGGSGEPGMSTVVVGDDVVAEALNCSETRVNTVVGVDAFTNNANASTVVKGGVTAKGGLASGIVAESAASEESPSPDAATGATVLVGQGGVSAQSDTGLDANGIVAFAKNSVVTVRVGGDVTAKSKDDEGSPVGITALGPSGVVDVLVEGTVTAKDAGVLNQKNSGQLEVTVWKIVSDIVGAKWDNVAKACVEDEALEAAINYIIKVEQPKEGNVLKLIGASVKKATMVDGDRSFDVSHMGQKLYLDVEEGWAITAAFNGDGEKVPLDKDDQGWFVVVPNGGGVYLSAQVAKVEPSPEPLPKPEPSPEPEPAPAPEPTPAPGPAPEPAPAPASESDSAYAAADDLPATGDSDTAVMALALTAFASLMLALLAASRMRFHRES